VSQDRDIAAEAAGTSRAETAAGAAGAAERVQGILAAAEAAAEKIRAEAEARMSERIAEGDRAAEFRVKAAEEETSEAIKLAQEEALRIRSEAEEAKTEAANQALTVVQGEAAGVRAEADERARSLIADARDTAAGVRAEGLELVSHLREMGDSLKANADRLLRDVQRIHSRMTRELDSVGSATDEPEVTASRSRPSAADESESLLSPTGEVLDVPEFLPGH
jgi:hypothetical protein